MTDENLEAENEEFEPEVETQKIWRMPEPVFRTSEGTSYTRAEIDEEEDLHETHEQIPKPQAKSSKMPFFLGGAFLLFFLVTAALVGIWYLRNLEVPKPLTPPLEKATPSPTPLDPNETPKPAEANAALPENSSAPEPPKNANAGLQGNDSN